MKKLIKIMTAILAVATVVTAVPVSRAADKYDADYRVMQKSLKSEHAPALGPYYSFAVDNVVYDSRGFYNETKPDTVHLMGNFFEITADHSAGEYYYKQDGKTVTVSMEDTRIVPQHEDGGYIVMLRRNEDGETYECDIFNKDGKLVSSSDGAEYADAKILGEYAIALYDADGNAHVEFWDWQRETVPYGDKLLNTMKVQDIGTFDGETAYFVQDGKYGLVGKRGEIIAEADYAGMLPLDNGYAIAAGKYDEKTGKYSDITVLDADGKEVYTSDEPLVYYNGEIAVTYDADAGYALKMLDASSALAEGQVYCYERDYHFISESQGAAGVVYNSNGDTVISDVIDISVDRSNQSIVALSASDEKYHSYDGNGNKLFTYDTDTAEAMYSGVVLGGDENGENVYLMQGERILSDTHDYYCDSASYGDTDVYVMADMDDATEKLTYTTYVLAKKSSLFYDSYSDHWALDAIVEVYEKGIMKGIGGDAFGTLGITTRAQVVTILWRLAGEPRPNGTYTAEFEKEWYSTAVKWGLEVELIYGLDGNIKPDTPITRAELAVMFYRYAQIMGMDTSASADISSFADESEVKAWSRDEFEWAVATGLINGRKQYSDSPVLLAPDGILTRAELAAVVSRCNFDE